MQLDGDGRALLFGETPGSLAPGAPLVGLNDLLLMRIAPDERSLASRPSGRSGEALGSSAVEGRRDAVAWFWAR